LWIDVKIAARLTKEVVTRDPDQYISTSYVERQNLSLRMGSRRFTRLTNGFSKKLDNHVAAVALYVAHYFGRGACRCPRYAN
jgi:hypothetical protein